jgi:hypothetical protein
MRGLERAPAILRGPIVAGDAACPMTIRRRVDLHRRKAEQTHRDDERHRADPTQEDMGDEGHEGDPCRQHRDEQTVVRHEVKAGMHVREQGLPDSVPPFP